MRNSTYVIAALGGALLLAGCSGSASSSPAVPSLSQPSLSQPSLSQAGAGHGAASQGTAGQLTGSGRAAALHAAAQCIRQHGISSYADPVLTPGGQVYSDSRSIHNAGAATFRTIQRACSALIATAGLNPQQEPPAPAQLVQAGVRAAQCMRAHGLPNFQDPTAQSTYVPGHGFQLINGEIPAGGKASAIYQRARQACDAPIQAEIRASTLASLGDDG
jgi:hypothetical protein